MGVVVALVLLAPMVILAGVFSGGSETWDHLATHLLGTYLWNSTLLVFGVGVATLLLGLPTAWLIATCDFPGRSVLAWALVLPLATPTYIMAFTYAELLAHDGPIQLFLQRGPLAAETTAILRTTLMSLPGAGLMMTLVLYPYVYLISRTSFQKQSGGILESARMLGKGPWSTFFRVALPLARPGVVAGVTLVTMEVLNEYGAVKYFGVSTFTTGIFRAWFSLGDGPAAIRLSAALLLLVLMLILMERHQRGRARFDPGSSRYRPPARVRLRGWKAPAALAVCSVPVLLGFVVPVAQLGAWSFQVRTEALDPRFIRLVVHSFSLASAAALVTVLAALLIVYAVRLSPTPLLRFGARVSSLGYSIPGAVIAVGLLIPFLWLDRQLLGVSRALFGMSGMGLLLTGTVGALLFAYVVRFLAVAINPLDSGFERICGKLDETSRSLGASPLRTLLRVDLPLLRGTLGAAALLVFVDVLKELPLTLILRPFDFDTLATRAFQLASDEQVARSALPALLIIGVGLLPVILLSRLIAREN
jgi:iron(III) transport system permease protein